jgi:hypothetical protein
MGKKQTLWSRMTNIFTANAHYALNKAENSEAAMQHTLRKYTNQIVDAEASVARVIALQKQREKDLAKLNESIEKLGKMVTSAVEATKNEKDPVKAGKLENTAIDLALKLDAQKAQAKTLQTTIKEQAPGITKLEAELNQMRQHKTNLENDLSLLTARKNTVDAQKNMAEAMRVFDGSDVSSDMARFEEHISMEESKVEAAQDLRNSSPEARYEALVGADTSREEMKRKLGL